MKKIYIAGRITGFNDYRQFFNAAENLLKNRGYRVVNPIKLGIDLLSYNEQIKICFDKIDECDCIYMLNNYPLSYGAQMELLKAKRQGLEIIFQPPQNLEDILNTVCLHTNITFDDAIKKTRKREIVEARYVFYAIAKNITDTSHEVLADFVNQDHSTVSYGLKQVENIREIKEKYEYVKSKINF